MDLSSTLSVKNFLDAARKLPVIDVRTPSEFANGHIPGAVNMPVFSDEERAVVGTLYTKESKESSVIKGLEFVGPKMANFARQAHELAVGKQLLVHCWRGGMRSSSMAWLFRTTGLQIATLEGGYKTYRRHFREQLNAREWRFVVVGGPTGSGKTDVLKALEQEGEQVLDLEGLANHKGSAFGALGQEEQPSSEHFENLIHQEFLRFDSSKIVWVEGESHSIGRVYVPDLLFERLMKAPLIMFELDREKRLDRLVREYGGFEKNLLATSVQKIKKRLGDDRTREAINALEEGDYRKVADITLKYYDKGYNKSLARRNSPLLTINVEEDNPQISAKQLIEKCRLCIQ